MAQQHLILLPFIALLLACCVTPSAQQGLTYTTSSDTTNGTVISWPLIQFSLGSHLIAYPQVHMSTTAVLFPNSSIDMTTEFFDANTNEILESRTAVAESISYAAGSNLELTITREQVISPCQVLLWNTTKRSISVRNIVFFSTTSMNISTLSQTLKIDSTLQDGLSQSVSPITYKAIVIPASKNNPHSVFQVNGSLQSTSSKGLPFDSFCFNRQGSCGNTDCFAKGDIAAGSTSQNFSADDVPSGVYYLYLDTSLYRDNVSYFFTAQVTGEGYRITNNLLNVLLPICTLVFIGALHW